MGEDIGQGASERDVGRAAAQRLDRCCVIQGDETLDRNTDPIAEIVGDHIDVAEQLFRVFLWDERECEGGIVRRHRPHRKETGAEGKRAHGLQQGSTLSIDHQRSSES